MRRTWLLLSWLGATIVVSWLTFQALAAADSGVRDSPRTAVVMDTLPLVEDETRTSTTPAPATVPPSQSTDVTSEGGGSATPAERLTPTTSTAPGTPSSTAPTSSTSTSQPDAGTTSSTTSTTIPTSTTTSILEVEEAWTTTTITSPGGNLTVSYRTGEVRYEAAVPAAGYDLEVESTGPEVRVEFTDGEGDGWRIRARWDGDGFSPEVTET